MNNFISLYGEVLDYPQQASVDKKGTEYYKFNIAVQRESGIIDILPIVVEEDTAEALAMKIKELRYLLNSTKHAFIQQQAIIKSQKFTIENLVNELHKIYKKL